MSIKSRLLFNLMYLLPGRPPWDTGISPPELVEFINQQPPGRALDLGCGTGTNAITLARAGWDVTGIDFARPAVQTARKKARHAGLDIDFRIGSAAKPTVKGPYDLVLDIGCFHSLSRQDREDYTQNLLRLLAVSGTYLLYAFFRQPSEDGPGLVEEDLKTLTDRLYLVNRRNGTERAARPSAWFTYIRQA